MFFGLNFGITLKRIQRIQKKNYKNVNNNNKNNPLKKIQKMLNLKSEIKKIYIFIQPKQILFVSLYWEYAI